MLSRWAEEEWRRTKPKRSKEERERRGEERAENSSVHDRKPEPRAESKQKLDRSRATDESKAAREANQGDVQRGEGKPLSKNRRGGEEHEHKSAAMSSEAPRSSARKSEERANKSQQPLTKDDMVREEKLREREERIREREEMLRQWELSQEKSRASPSMSDSKKRSLAPRRDLAPNRSGGNDMASSSTDTSHFLVSRASGASVPYSPSSNYTNSSPRPLSSIPEPSPRQLIQVRCWMIMLHAKL